MTFRLVVALVGGIVGCAVAGCRAAPSHQPVTTLPHPYPIRAEDILEDIAAQMNVRDADYGRLARLDGSLVIGEKLNVESETPRPDYFAIRLDDRASGRPAFRLAMSKDGFFQEASMAGVPESGEPTPPARPSLEDIVKKLEAKFGRPIRARYVLVMGSLEFNMGAAVGFPSVRADTPVGRLYVNAMGEVWRETHTTPRPAPGQAIPMGDPTNRVERLIIRRETISHMARVADLH